MTKVPADTGKGIGNDAGLQPRRGATVALVTVCSLVIGSVAVGTVAGVASSDKETRHAPYLASALPDEGPWAHEPSSGVEFVALTDLAHVALGMSPRVAPESVSGPEAIGLLDPRALSSTSYTRDMRSSANELVVAVPDMPAFEIEEFTIDFKVVVRTDASMEPGAERVLEAGAQGVGRVVYRMVVDDDGRMQRVEVERVIDLPAKDRVVVRGPKPASTPSPQPSPRPSATKAPAPQPEPTPTPVETTPVTPKPSPSPSPSPSSSPSPDPKPKPSPSPSPSPSTSPSPDPKPKPEPSPEPTPTPVDEEHLKKAGSKVIGPGGTAASNKALARQLAQSLYGWGEDEFGCLDTLWQRESSWNHRAANPNSSARGLPQAMMSVHFRNNNAAGVNEWWHHPQAQTYLNSPEAQIRWGLNYIRTGASRGFTTPCEAWKVWKGKGWY